MVFVVDFSARYEEQCERLEGWVGDYLPLSFIARMKQNNETIDKISIYCWYSLYHFSLLVAFFIPLKQNQCVHFYCFAVAFVILWFIW